MTAVEAERLLLLSREARWASPSSSGKPVRGDEDWLERVTPEREAFAEAARFLLESGDDEAALEIAANVWLLWMLSREIADGRRFLGNVLDRADATPSRSRALALYGDGLFAFWQGARDDSRRRNEAALQVGRAVEDPEALALASLGLARVALDDGEHERARGLARDARGLARELGPAMGQAPLHMHAQAARAGGEYDEAAALFEESLELNRRLGDEGMVEVELHNLGHVELRRGNVDAAERHFAECAEPGDNDPYGAALTLLDQAAVAFARDDRERAAALLTRAESVLVENGIDLASDDALELDRLRGRLDDRV